MVNRFIRNRTDSEKRLLKAVENAKNLKPIVSNVDEKSEVSLEDRLSEEYEPAYEKNIPDHKKPATIINDLSNELPVFDETYNKVNEISEDTLNENREVAENLIENTDPIEDTDGG